MATAPDPGPIHTVSTTDASRAQIRALYIRARRIGTNQRVSDAIRRLMDRLAREPNQLGELLFTLRAAKLHVRAAALDPVYVEFGVHADAPFVVVRRVAGMGRLGGPPG